MGKIGLMAGTAAIAMFAASGASAATNNGAAASASQPSGMIQLAQADTPPSNVDLEARISALESEVQDSEMRAAQAANAAPPPAPSGWWSNTSVSGRMYFDVTNIKHSSNGAKTATQGDNGTNFDIKRLYIGIDHSFNDVFSANITTDMTYDSSTKASQLYLKKAYLQAKIDPAFTVRVGATDMPWVPFVEGIYGYRYLENTLTELPKFGTSSDWGIHALGSMFDGILNYDVAAINGGGYKIAPTGGGVNRFKSFDYEGRVNLTYDGFGLGVGGYSGKLGQPFGVTTFHTANRVDALASYVGYGLRLGLEYFSASNWKTVTTVASDSAHGLSGFGSYYFLPEWAVFARYDEVKPSIKLTPTENDDYYNFGITWTPVKTVDLSLTYKHDGVSHGILVTQNGLNGIGGSIAGSYNEIGVFGDWQF